MAKLTRIGDELAVIFDQPLLDRLGLDENSEVEVSRQGDVLVITPIRPNDQRRTTNDERP